MILYQALSTYQILECIEHRQIYHSEDQCGLLLGTYIVEKFPNYKYLECFFERVYLFEFGGIAAKEDTLLPKIEDEFEKTVGCTLEEIEKFYIAGIHTYLQVLMLHKGVSFEMFEDGSGALSRPWVLANIHQGKDPVRYEILNKYGLYTHDSSLIEKKWCDFHAQLPDFHDDKAVDFNVLHSFEKLNEETQKKVLTIFGVEEKIDVNGVDMLVLTQQFSNLGQLSFEDHVLIYQNLFDYYLKDCRIAIKTHPDDIMYYSILFPEAKIVNETFPSELIPFVFRELPSRIGTVTSTGINLIADYFDSVLRFNEQYEVTFKNNAIYYIALSLIQYLGVTSLSAVNVNEVQLGNLIEFNREFSNMRISEAEFAVVGEMDCSDVGYKEVIRRYQEGEIKAVLFLNTGNGYVWETEEWAVWDELIPIGIRKTRNVDFDNEYYDTEGEFVLYFMSHDKEMRDKVKEYNTEVTLKNTGTTISVQTYSEQEMEIRMLRGKLEATERRLLEYIENEKKLKARIADYEGK